MDTRGPKKRPRSHSVTALAKSRARDFGIKIGCWMTGVAAIVSVLTLWQLHDRGLQSVISSSQSHLQQSLSIGDEYQIERVLHSITSLPEILSIELIMGEGQWSGVSKSNRLSALEAGLQELLSYQRKFEFDVQGSKALIIVNSYPPYREFGVAFFAILALLVFWIRRLKRAFFDFSGDLISPVRDLPDLVSNEMNMKDGFSSTGIIELDQVASRITKYYLEHQKLKSEIDQKTARGELARQVSHDIRSPIAALKVLSKQLKGLEGSERKLLDSAIKRISDIANSLSRHSQQGPSQTQKIHLPTMIENLVSEKRIEFATKDHLQVDFEVKPEVWGAFVEGDESELIRMLSNLINNSVEALPNESGCVQVILQFEHGELRLSVVDNGSGIPPELLDRVTENGFSFGKRRNLNQGRGIGLSHAKNLVENMGGSIEIRSELGQGTQIHLRFRISGPPEWFCNRLDLAEGGSIAIVDDDPSIFLSWKNVLEPYANLLFFNNPHDYVKAMSDQDFHLTLMDHSYGPEIKNGLEVISELPSTENIVLMTSDSDYRSIGSACSSTGVKMIMKSCIGSIPITWHLKPVMPKNINSSMLSHSRSSLHRSRPNMRNQ